MHKECHAGSSLYQGANSRSIVMAHDEIALPVAGDDAIGDFFGTLFYADEVLYSAVPIAIFTVDSTVLVLAAQAL